MREVDYDFMYEDVLQKLAELDPNLTYHNIEHTLDVIYHCERIALEEGVGELDRFLLKVAALYHDTGFLEAYVGHEVVSCRIFTEGTSQYNVSEEDNRKIIDMIMATKVPQKPNNLLQRIICDADLDYLGREDFSRISNNLKDELFHHGFVANDDEWKELQITFLKSHHFHTPSSRRLRQPEKIKNMASL